VSGTRERTRSGQESGRAQGGVGEKKRGVGVLFCGDGKPRGRGNVDVRLYRKVGAGVRGLLEKGKGLGRRAKRSPKVFTRKIGFTRRNVQDYCSSKRKGVKIKRGGRFIVTK